MLHYRAAVASQQIHGLAEGPLWDAPRRRVLWVDINAGKVHSGTLDGTSPGGDRILPDRVFSIPGTAGAVVCSPAGELLVAGARTLHTVAGDGTVTAGPQLVPADRPSRLNDGACDPAGRFLVGSMDLAGGRRGGESLYRLETSGVVTVIDDDLTLSNGLAFSPDGSSFYSIDTVPGVLWVRSYDAATGRCGQRTVLLEIDNGSPDGMCVDGAGNLWVAIWGGCEVRCFSPTGQQLAVVDVAAPHVTSVAFVGPDLDILLITTAAEQLTADQLARYPDSGRLFTCRVGATGTPVAPWAGAAW
jgi:sugar lactone lactonase YvrE